MADDEGTEGRAGREGIPNANSPQLLTHLLELVARGVRSQRSLQEALGVDRRTVLYYVQAGQWLGFLQESADPLLSPEGLGYVYAGPGRRAAYAAAVERQPFVRHLIETRGDLPDDATLVRAIREADPALAVSTAQRRASAVRGLVAPWVDERAARRLTDDAPSQLPLPLSQAPKLELEPPLTRAAGRSFSPDIYRYLLCYLLDHGELTLGHVRGLLDHAGASDVPIGGYVDLAIERGDAARVDERIVATAAAVLRREIAASTSAVILSDGGWRAHLDALRAQTQPRPSRPAVPEGPTPPTSGRYRLWDQRLFGRQAVGEEVDAELHRVLRDRSLASWPRTQRGADAPPIVAEPFLDAWVRDVPLVIALPPSLAQLWEGVAGINRRLRNARHRADAVGAPSIAYRPSVVHGGLLHPNEPSPRAVADLRALRQRLVMHAPYVAMVTAFLLGHRSAGTRAEVVRERHEWWVRSHRRKIAPLLEVVDDFAAARGWLASRRPGSGLEGDTLVALLERIGILLRADERVVLDDAFFLQLRAEEEEMIVGAALEPLAEALIAHVEGLAAHAPRGHR